MTISDEERARILADAASIEAEQDYERRRVTECRHEQVLCDEATQQARGRLGDWGGSIEATCSQCGAVWECDAKYAGKVWDFSAEEVPRWWRRVR